jgi:hypothetical protein
LVEHQNQGRQFVSGLASKPLGWFVSGLASKPLGKFSPVWPQNRWRWFLGSASQPRWWRVFRFGSQNQQLRFGVLCPKITTTVSLFGSQNHVGFDLPVAPQNRREDASAWDTRRDLAVCFAWKQVWLEFPVWPQDWRRRDGRWCTWHHCGGCVGIKLKTDGSMRWAVLDPFTLALPFSVY